VLTDMSGVYSDLGGKGSVLAAEMAIDDFKAQFKPASSRSNWSPPTTRTRPTSAPTRRASGTTPRVSTWSPTAQFRRGAGGGQGHQGEEQDHADGTRRRTSTRSPTRSARPNTVHWTYDTYALANGTGKAVTKQGKTPGSS
jgi:branched-chain amino acid transport system substrate-binding protein